MKSKECMKQMGIMLTAVCVMFGSALSVTTNAASKSDRALEAYRSYLLSSEVEADNIGWYQGQFGMMDLNKDGISELIVTGDGMYRFNIYAYVGGKVVIVGSGYSGDYMFCPNKS